MPRFDCPPTRATWGARCGKPARRVLRGGTGTSALVARPVPTHYNIQKGTLLELVKERISDRRVLKLIRQWLDAGVMEDGTVRETLAGTPQGGVISPLLANIYLNKLDRIWAARCGQLGKLIRYADDFVAMCRTESAAREALRRIGLVMDRLGLTLHPAKTRLVDLRRGKESFVFLGCTIRKRRSIQRNPRWHFMQRWPSPKATKKLRAHSGDHQQAAKREGCEASHCGTDSRASRLGELLPDGQRRPGVQSDRYLRGAQTPTLAAPAGRTAAHEASILYLPAALRHGPASAEGHRGLSDASHTQKIVSFRQGCLAPYR